MRTEKLFVLVNVLLGAGFLLLAIVIAVHPTEYPAMLVGVFGGLSLGTQWINARARKNLIQRGVWDERAYVVASLDEAIRRGLTPADWLIAYQERIAAEAMSLGIHPDQQQNAD